MKNPLLYRVENPNTLQGLWYDKDGNFNPFIKTLSNALCADMPMGFDPVFSADGHAWLSATDNLPDIGNWFSHQDMIELTALGYYLMEYEVTGYREVYGHAIFTRQSVVSERIIDFNTLY